MAWRVAESLEKLRRQLNAAFPNRSKISDGGIGDAKHASRSSDHNPWVKDRNGVGVVTARDFTHDPKNGLDCNKLAEWLIESRDPRIKYIIWNKRILSSQNAPWRWRPYSGANSHSHHLHLSVNSDPKLYDSAKEWDLDVAITLPVHAVKPVAMLQNPLANLTKEEENNLLEIKEFPAIEPKTQTAVHSPAVISANPPSTATAPPAIQTPEQQNAGTEQSATQTTETGGTTTETTVAIKNEQDVNQPAAVTEPKPQGFLGKLTAGAATLLGGTLIYDAAGKLSGIQFTMQTVYILCFILFLLFLGFCVWAILDAWKSNKRTELEANAKTAIDRKDIVWVKPKQLSLRERLFGVSE